MSGARVLRGLWAAPVALLAFLAGSLPAAGAAFTVPAERQAPPAALYAPDGAAGSLWLPVRQSDGSYAFQNKNSGLCLDVYGGGSDLGRQLDQWPCKNTAGSNQDFTPR